MIKTTTLWPGKWIPLLVLLFIALLYLIFFPVNYDFDGTVFSQFLRYGLAKGDLITIKQPQHPIYMPVNYAVYKILDKLFGYSVLEYFHLQLFSLVFGLALLWFVYKILCEITGYWEVGTAGLILTASAYGIWYYTVEAEVHMPGLFFTAAGMYVLFFKTHNKDGIGVDIAAALCFVLAVGFHLTNGLMVFSLFLIFIIEKYSFKRICRFFSIYFLFLLGGFLVFSWLHRFNFFDYYRTQFTGGDILAGYRISYWSGKTPVALWESFQSVAHGILFPCSSFLGVISISIFIGGLAVIVVRSIRRNKNSNKLLIYAGLWALPYFIFFSFWDHRNIEFKLHVLLPFLLLWVSSLVDFFKSGRRVPVVILLVLTAIIGFSNFFSSVKPSADIENNREYGLAEAVKKSTPPGSLIVIAGCGPRVSIVSKIYFPYFGHRKTLNIDWVLGRDRRMEEIERFLKREKARGVPVFIFSDLLEDGEAVRLLLENHHIDETGYSRFLRSLKPDEKETVRLPGNYYLKRF